MSVAGGAGPAVLVLRAEPEAGRTAQAVVRAGLTRSLRRCSRLRISGKRSLMDHSPRSPSQARRCGRLAQLPPELSRGTPVFAVGAQTAQAAGKAGFTELHIAEGDRHALADLLLARLPAGTRLLLALGRDRHEDWIERLAANGLKPAIWTCYEARPVAALPRAAAEALAAQTPPMALHFSRRGAETFLALATQAALAGRPSVHGMPHCRQMSPRP